jgi:seryl-tRNA synthetase
MHFRLPFENAIDPELAAELEKAAAYATPRLKSFRLTSDRSAADIECTDGAQDEVSEKVHRVVRAMVASFRSLGEPEELVRRGRRDELPIGGGAFAELSKRRWARTLGRGQVSFAGGAFALKRFLDDAVADLARARFGAAEEDHPALLDPDVLVRCGYFSSFPHSVSLVSHLTEDFDAIEAFRVANTGSETLKVPDPGALRSTDAVLRPAVCLPVYRALEDTSLPAGGLAITTSGKAFRYESSNMEGIQRLWDFSMREIVFVGSSQDVESRRTELVEATSALMEEWDLGFRLVSGSDPFFATVRGSKALWQRTRAVKYEMIVDVGSTSIAAGSINFAGTLFGDAFCIRTDAGDTATTACIGFGLERLVLALFSQHGFEAARWPRALREVVFG